MSRLEMETEKLYYSIGDVSSKFHVPASLLRYWEKEFPEIIQPRKGSHGRRMYTAENISAISILYDLIKNQGYTLDGAKRHFKESRKENNETDRITAKLIKIKSSLLGLKSKVKE